MSKTIHTLREIFARNIRDAVPEDSREHQAAGKKQIYVVAMQY